MPRLSEQRAVLRHVLVEIGDVLAIPVIEQGRHAHIGAQDALGFLSPTRMIEGRIDVGPEAVFSRLDFFPEAFGRLSVKVMLTIDLADLNPYFQGKARRIGAPCWGGAGLP